MDKSLPKLYNKKKQEDVSMEPANENKTPSAFLTANFFKRVVTAVLLGGLTLWLLISENPFLIYFMGAIAVIVLIEWGALLQKATLPWGKYLTFLIFGGAYLGLGLFGFYHFYTYSPLLGIALLFVIWSTDIGAYFAGKIIGGPKLAPSISPGKTWSGALGGTLSAALTALVISVYLYDGFNIILIAFFMLCSLLGQVGDLLESKTKRVLKVKDSGTLLPGHGGFIDRLDSLIFIGMFLMTLSFFTSFQAFFNL